MTKKNNNTWVNRISFQSGHLYIDGTYASENSIRLNNLIRKTIQSEHSKWNKEMREMIGEYEKGYYNPNGKFRNAENAEQMVRNMFRKELLEQLEKKK